MVREIDCLCYSRILIYLFSSSLIHSGSMRVSVYTFVDAVTKEPSTVLG